MGNWASLNTWIEYDNNGNAQMAYDYISILEKSHEWMDKDKYGLRYGFLNEKVLQIQTSQKWGLDGESIWVANSKGNSMFSFGQIFGPDQKVIFPAADLNNIKNEVLTGPYQTPILDSIGGK